MAVSLKKPQKVDLSKPENPPPIREYTPVHLIDEESTIQRPRQPPIQPQHLTKSEHCPMDNEIEVNSNDEDLENARKHLKDLRRKYQYPLLISIASACLIVLVVLLIRTFSPSGNISVESVPTENFSDVVTSAAASVESVPTNNTSSYFGYISDFVRFAISFIVDSPVAICFLTLTFLTVFIRIIYRCLNR